MILYFADRQFNITGQATTSLPGGFRVTEDLLTEEVSPGVNTFSFKVACNDRTRNALEDAIKVGSFVLRSNGRNDEEGWYNSLFQVIETEFDTSSMELSVYAEDAGLDLINRTCSSVELKNKTLVQMLQYFMPGDWDINVIGAPTGAKSYKWDGENTATERINSVANLFGCEVYYTFVVERLKVTSKIINVTQKRGEQNATAQLRLNKDINSITTKKSIADIATVLRVTGGTPEGAKTPINLKNYSYSYTDPGTGDVYEVDTVSGRLRNVTAMRRWASAIDTDGFIVKNFQYETTSKAVLASQARAKLQELCNETVQYDVDIVYLPDGVRIGDRVNIIDEAGELYLEARILKLETSIITPSVKAIIGDYVIRGSGINETVARLAAEFAANARETLEELTTITSDISIISEQVNGNWIAETIFTGSVNEENTTIDVDQLVNAIEEGGDIPSIAEFTYSEIGWLYSDEVIDPARFGIITESPSEADSISISLTYNASIQEQIGTLSEDVNAGNAAISNLEEICQVQDVMLEAQSDAITALETESQEADALIEEQAATIEVLEGKAEGVESQVTMLEGRASSLESEIEKVSNAVIINPDEPSIIVKSGNGSVKVMDGEIDILGDGNTVAHFDSTAFHSRQAEISELSLNYLAPGELIPEEEGFIFEIRQNGHLSLKRRA